MRPLIFNTSVILTTVFFLWYLQNAPPKRLNPNQGFVETVADQGNDEPVGFSQNGSVGTGLNKAVTLASDIELCAFVQDGCPTCGASTGCRCQNPGYYDNADGLPSKFLLGVDQNSNNRIGKESNWQDAKPVPWESYGYGEYLGPHRTPHLPIYRLRIGDQVEFVYMLTRTKSWAPYRVNIGDTLQVSSGGDSSLNQPNVLVMKDGAISLPLIGTIDASGKTLTQLADDLNAAYSKTLVKEPAITVQVLKGDTLLSDLRDAVDARAGQGGQSKAVTVSPDGTVQLPFIGAVPAIGLTLDEIAEEINARYEMKVHGISVTPILVNRSPRAIYVTGLVAKPGKYDITGPTSLMQAIALAGGTVNGGNLRSIVVFRRDQNWRLVATRLDIAGAMYGKQPHPSDEIWLRDSDIVLIPPQPIQRFSQAVDLYLRKTVYAIFPQQNLVFNFDTFQTF